MDHPLARQIGRRRSARRRIVVLALCAVMAIPAGLAVAQQSTSPFTVAETGQGFGRLQDAVNAIGAGQGTIRIAPGSYHDCAVQTAGSVDYVATEPGKAILAGTACEGKAGLVLRGEAAKIDGLIFEHFGVSDGNGAGIRLEKGDLSVRQSWFRDSEEGILTADDPVHTITIDQSTFTRLGRCDRGLSCAHSVYTGEYGVLTVTRSRFEAGRGGHYVKSRASRVAINDSSFDDSKGHTTNYMIDLPAGSAGTIRGNWFVQGADKENYSCFIAIAAEARQHSSDGLAISGNDARFAPGVSRSSVFVADWVGDRIAIGENALGRGLSKFERR
jgi:hypothetical protein